MRTASRTRRRSEDVAREVLVLDEFGELLGHELLVDLERALTLEPERIDALYNKALVLYELKQYKTCLRELDRILKSVPDGALALNLAGLCFGQLGDAERAVAFFSRAIASNSSNGQFWLNRSWAFDKLRDNRRALSDAIQAQRMGTRVDPAYLNRLRN